MHNAPTFYSSHSFQSRMHKVSESVITTEWSFSQSKSAHTHTSIPFLHLLALALNYSWCTRWFAFIIISSSKAQQLFSTALPHFRVISFCSPASFVFVAAALQRSLLLFVEKHKLLDLFHKPFRLFVHKLFSWTFFSFLVYVVASFLFFCRFRIFALDFLEHQFQLRPRWCCGARFLALCEQREES